MSELAVEDQGLAEAGAVRPEVMMSRGRKVFYVIVILIAVPLVYFFVFRGMRFFRVPSNSMLPTIQVSDFILTLHEQSYDRGDVVVLRDPNATEGYLVKRIVGISGDRVAVRGGAIFLNGAYASEPYRMEPMEYRMSEYQVAPGDVFLMGDNRNWSMDSHNFGADGTDASEVEPAGVSANLIVGKVYCIYLPFERMGKVISYPVTRVEGP